MKSLAYNKVYIVFVTGTFLLLFSFVSFRFVVYVCCVVSVRVNARMYVRLRTWQQSSNFCHTQTNSKFEEFPVLFLGKD